MAQPFDITLKHLLEAHPADCLRLVDLPTSAPVEVIDADLAAVTAEADKVFRIHDRPPWLMHFELQASYDANLPERMLRYNVLLKYRHKLPVRSVVILLRPLADGPAMTGVARHTLGDEQYLEFRYRAVRLWQKPVEAVLAGGVGTLPLVPLAAVNESELPALIRRMKQRLSTAVEPSEEAQLWTATFLLMGLRYDKAVTAALPKGVREMRESVTYQAILEEGEAKGKAEGKAEGKADGKVEEAQRILLRIATRKLGHPDQAANAAVAAIHNHVRLEALIDRVMEVDSWQELLAQPRSRRRGGKRKGANGNS